MLKNNSARLRVAVPLLVLLVVSVGFVLNYATGTLSGFGWKDIVLLCPLGALGTMLASKLLIPQALISLGIAVALIALLGPIFCGWICPVPLVQKIRGIFGKPKREEARNSQNAVEVLSDGGKDSVETEVVEGSGTPLIKASEELSESEKVSLRGCDANCSSCKSKREKLDSRHLILGGALLSATIFGFPVFCLICPIGLTFASILLVIRLFSDGDVTLSLLIVPAFLILEVVVFRKWCSKICPLSAFMSLIAKVNKTFKPQVDVTKCVEVTQGKKCGLCSKACEVLIDPRHPELGTHEMNECTRCRACVDSCPGQAITIPFLPRTKKLLERAAESKKER